MSVLLALSTLGLALQAQTTIEAIKANPNLSGGVYYAYPVNAPKAVTKPPKGYHPFYISHYGRHGSRYLISESDYAFPRAVLAKAAEDGELTPLGIDVLARIDSLMIETSGRGGDLSPLGVRQHRGIAERMYEAYPRVFMGDAKVDAKSTTVIRCVLSMDAFCERLKELNPKIKTSRNASNREMVYMNYHSDESNAYTSGDWRIEYEKFEKERVKPERLMRALFKSEDYVRKNIRMEKLFWALFWLAADMQDVETKLDFYDLFTPEELFGLWEAGNFHNYVCDANWEGSQGLVVGNATNLVNDIIRKADLAIEGKGNAADLRFGHDGNLMPLAAFLGIGNAGVKTGEAEKIASLWSNNQISPMAGNIQIVFFHKNGESEPLVKFLLNEEETALEIPSDNFPFYPWSKVKRYLQERMEEAGGK